MTEPSPDNNPQDDAALSKAEARRLEMAAAVVGVLFFAALGFGIWFAVKQVADKPLPPPSFVPTGDIAAQSEIHADDNRMAYDVSPPSEADVPPDTGAPAEQLTPPSYRQSPQERMRDYERARTDPDAPVTSRPQDSDIDGAPPQPAYAAEDPLRIMNAHLPYDRPIGVYDADPKWLTVRGRVTKIVPRSDRMTDGSRRENLYARTEFYYKESNMNCYFHQYLGLTTTLQVGDYVLVQYDPRAKDPCGTSHIVK